MNGTGNACATRGWWNRVLQQCCRIDFMYCYGPLISETTLGNSCGMLRLCLCAGAKRHSLPAVNWFAVCQEICKSLTHRVVRASTCGHSAHRWPGVGHMASVSVQLGAWGQPTQDAQWMTMTRWANVVIGLPARKGLPQRALYLSWQGMQWGEAYDVWAMRKSSMPKIVYWVYFMPPGSSGCGYTSSSQMFPA